MLKGLGIYIGRYKKQIETGRWEIPHEKRDVTTKKRYHDQGVQLDTLWNQDRCHMSGHRGDASSCSQLYLCGYLGTITYTTKLWNFGVMGHDAEL